MARAKSPVSRRGRRRRGVRGIKLTPAEKLCVELQSDPAYARGERLLDPAPTPARGIEALRVIYDASEELDERMPAVAANLGREIACRKGCPGRCCDVLILVSEIEARYIANELRRPERSADRELFVDRIRAWDRQVGDNARAGAEAFAAGRHTAYRKAVHAHAAAQIPCPFLTDSVCQVHAARPLPCREAWVVDTHEHCHHQPDPGAPQPVRLTHPGLEKLMDQARVVTAGLQSSTGKGVARRPLPLAVLPLIESGD